MGFKKYAQMDRLSKSVFGDGEKWSKKLCWARVGRASSSVVNGPAISVFMKDKELSIKY